MFFYRYHDDIFDGMNVQSAYELLKEVYVPSTTEVCDIARVGYKGGNE
jgi:hypothetical protein